jgi:iron complex outermembrane receptor protein
MTRRMTIRYVLAASTLLSPFVAAPVFAAEQVQDIVVTAQKREERLQEVPIAVTALSAAQIETRGLTTMASISALAPNLTTSMAVSGGSDVTMAIRGQSVADALLTQDGPVGLYIDGVINSRISGALTDLIDLQRIEVLRGPQGTLYGRNTTGGAVNFITRKPGKEFGITQKFGVQTYGGVTSRTSIDTGEIGDTGLTATFNLLYKKIGGYWDNLARPDKEDPGAENVRAGRFAINYDKGGAFRANYQIIHSESETGNVAGQITGVGPVFRGPAVTLPLITSQRRDEFNYPALGTADSILTMHNFTAEYDLNENLMLKSITGYRKWQDTSQGAVFGEEMTYITPNATFTGLTTATGVPFIGANERSHEQFTQEVQLNGQYGDKVAGGDRLNFALGGYWFSDNGSERQTSTLIFPTFIPGFGPVAFGASNPFSYNTTSESWAVFGQASFTPNILNDKLRFTGGLRYSADKKATTLFNSNTVFVPARAEANADFDAVTYLAKAQYFLTDDLNAYVSYSKGYKAGGFNTRGSLEKFDPEILYSYEAGLKANWFDRRLQTNIAAFFNELQDQQVAQFIAGPTGAISIVSNAGKSEYTGLEFEIVAKPMQGITLDWNMGFVNPEYKEYITNDPGTLLPFDAAKVARFGYVSQTTGAAGVQYDSQPIAAFRDGKIQARVEAVWQSKQDFHPAIFYPSGAADNPNVNATTSDARTIINARISLQDVTFGAGTVDFSLWGKNLGDEEYVVQGVDFGALDFATQSFGAPLTAGFEVAFRY